MKDFKETLKAMRATLAKGFCQKAIARKEDGSGCEPGSPGVTQWCILGALYLALPVQYLNIPFEEREKLSPVKLRELYNIHELKWQPVYETRRHIQELLRVKLTELSTDPKDQYANTTIIRYNDSHTQAEVLTFFDKVISELENPSTIVKVEG